MIDTYDESFDFNGGGQDRLEWTQLVTYYYGCHVTPKPA